MVEADAWYSQTYNLRQAAHKWGDNHTCRVILPRERGSRPTAGLSRPEILTRETEPPEHLVFLSGELRLWEIGTPLLECTQNPTCPKSQHMGSDLKGGWSNFLANLGEPPRGTGEQLGLPSGNTDAGGSHLGELI